MKTELSRYGGLSYFKHSPLSGTSEYIPEYIVTVHDGTDLNKCVNEELNTKIFPAQKSLKKLKTLVAWHYSEILHPQALISPSCQT